MFLPEFFRSSVMTLPCINRTDEVIPPYAVMALRPNSEGAPPINKGEGDAAVIASGPMEVSVAKPNQDDFNRGVGATFCFNTDVPIPKSSEIGRGRCVLTLPTFARIEFETCRELGCSLSPRPDSWELHRGAGMFLMRTWWEYETLDLALIDSGQATQIWIFRLTEDWSSGAAMAKVRPIDEEYDAENPEMEVHDPKEIVMDLVTGNEGYCQAVGGRHIVINAPCEG